MLHGSNRLLSRELDHPHRHVEANDLRATECQSESNVARACGKIERALAGANRCDVNEPLFPASILSVGQQDSDEIVPVGDRVKQGSNVPAFPVRRGNSIVYCQGAIG